ncbi:MAG: penicillin-binding transpeptidase domain-containing protein [Actinomycetota bacterium]
MKFGTRLTALAAAFFAMFGLVGIRLWFVQVAEGAQSAEIVEEQAWVQVPSQAARGDIFDRDGVLVVTSRFVPRVVVDRRFIHPGEKDEQIQRLSGLLGLPADALDRLYEEAGLNGRFPVTEVPTETAYRINEQLSELPGVSIEKLPKRVYLAGPTMAHVIGHLGFPDQADLEDRPNLDPNLRIGKLGVERVYDAYLQGTPGLTELRLNRQAEVIEETRPVQPVQGGSLHLTIDMRLQEVVKQALASGLLLANQVKDQDRAAGEAINHDAVKAASVVVDTTNGEILALVSLPDFDPSLFVGGMDSSTFSALNDAQAFNNLAISGLYPPASTFKAITYVASIEDDLPLPNGIPNVDASNGLVHCNGTLRLPGFEEGSQQIFHDWYTGDKGWLDLHAAFEQSCNIYFWSIALGTWRAYKLSADESVLQGWARQLGFGASTGVDLTGEASGIVPDRALFEEWKQFQVENPDAPARLDSGRLDLAEGPFVGGDLMNLAIGQGELTSTPLQLAQAYAALANGGYVYQPHVVSEVVGRDGSIELQAERNLVRQVPIDPATVNSLLADMNRVVTRGTAAAAFSDFGASLDRVGGKTGTGQTIAHNDNHAWFVGVGPLDSPRWVLVVLIDEGGSGGRVAAPVARHIMQYLMGEPPTPIVEGDLAD